MTHAEGLVAETFEYDLDANSEVEADKRRVLVYRHRVARAWIEHLKQAKQIVAGTRVDTIEYIEAFDRLLSVGLVGWRNLGLEYREGLTPADVLSALQLEHIATMLPICARAREYEQAARRIADLGEQQEAEQGEAASH